MDGWQPGFVGPAQHIKAPRWQHEPRQHSLSVLCARCLSKKVPRASLPHFNLCNRFSSPPGFPHWRLMLFWDVFLPLGACWSDIPHHHRPLRLPVLPSVSPCFHCSAPPPVQHQKRCWNKSFWILCRTKKLLLWLPAWNIHIALPWPYVPLVKGMFHY